MTNLSADVGVLNRCLKKTQRLVMSRARKERRDRPPDFTTCHIVRLIAGSHRLDVQAPGVPIDMIHAMLKRALAKVEEQLTADGKSAPGMKECGILDALCHTPQQPTQ
jgi:hypothetical protein